MHAHTLSLTHTHTQPIRAQMTDDDDVLISKQLSIGISVEA